MKYSIETTKNGWIESLEVDGIVCKKTWIETNNGVVCSDEDFCKQLKGSGKTDELLYEIWDKIDSSFFINDFVEVAKSHK